jgi:hypothetical protein
MKRLMFGPAMKRWPRTPEPPDPATVRLRTRASLAPTNTHGGIGL